MESHFLYGRGILKPTQVTLLATVNLIQGLAKEKPIASLYERYGFGISASRTRKADGLFGFEDTFPLSVNGWRY
jgi:hypothetical protein